MSFSQLKDVTLDEILNFSNGKKRPKDIGDIPVYGGNGILDYCNKSNSSGESLIIGRVGAYCGNVYLENKDCWVSDNAICAKVKEKIDSPYMYYKLTYMKLHNTRIGSSQPLLTQTILKQLQTKIHEYEEQKSIANILSTLDEKIEVNNKINQKLEEIAQAIFKQWFIDFDFPNEEGKSYKISGEELVESELGMIPKGWEVKSIDDITNLIIDYRGKTPKKLGYDWSESGIMALSAKHIKNNKLVNLESVKYVDEELYDKWMKDKLETGDVLMTSEAPLGEMYYLDEETKYCLSQRLYALRSDNNILKKSLFYYMLNSNNVKQDISNRATGTTVVGIRQVELRKVKMIVPDINVQEKFDNIINKILRKKSKLEIENSKLEKARDTLLPKLMSGEIRVLIDK